MVGERGEESLGGCHYVYGQSTICALVDLETAHRFATPIRSDPLHTLCLFRILGDLRDVAASFNQGSEP